MMDNVIAAYKERLNLQKAHFALINHEDTREHAEGWRFDISGSFKCRSVGCHDKNYLQSIIAKNVSFFKTGPNLAS